MSNLRECPNCNAAICPNCNDNICPFCGASLEEKNKCNHSYSRSMDQSYPRKCTKCGEIEKKIEAVK